MSYDAGNRRFSFSWTGLAFGGGTLTRVIKNPVKGSKMKVVAVNAASTTSFVGTTTPAKVQAGDGVTANKFADLFMGTAGAGTAAGSSVVAKDYASGLTGSNPASLPFLVTATDGDLTITFLAATGGAPAGAADVTVTVDCI